MADWRREWHPTPVLPGEPHRQYEKAEKLLQDNMMKLHELAKYLYEKETITGEEFMNILEGQTEKEA